MSDELLRQSIIDEEHLKLLSLGYMISAATTAFFSLIGLIYIAMGIFMSVLISHQREAETSRGQAPPAFVGWLFARNRDGDFSAFGQRSCGQTSNCNLYQTSTVANFLYGRGGYWLPGNSVRDCSGRTVVYGSWAQFGYQAFQSNHAS